MKFICSGLEKKVFFVAQKKCFSLTSIFATPNTIKCGKCFLHKQLLLKTNPKLVSRDALIS